MSSRDFRRRRHTSIKEFCIECQILLEFGVILVGGSMRGPVGFMMKIALYQFRPIDLKN